MYLSTVSNVIILSLSKLVYTTYFVHSEVEMTDVRGGKHVQDTD